jgi:hypothetical protein
VAVPSCHAPDTDHGTGQGLSVTEQTYEADPLRRDSLAAYSHVVQGMINKVLPVRLRPDITLDDVMLTQILHEKIAAASSVPPRRLK